MDLIGADPRRDPARVAPRKASASRSCSRRSWRGCRRRAGERDAPLRALIFDSYYDRYRGAIPSVRVVDGVDPRRDADQLRRASGRRLRSRRSRLQPAAASIRRHELGPGEVGYVVASVRDVQRDARGRHDLRREQARDASCCPATGTSSRWCSPGSIRRTPSSTRGCATRSRSCSSTTRLCTTSRRRPPRSASDSAAASSACCTWRSCRSGSSASSISISSRRCRPWSTTCTAPTARWSCSRIPSNLPDPAEIDRIEEPYVKARIMAPAEYIGPIMTLGTERRGVYKNMTTSTPRASSSTGSFRSARSCSTSSTS